MAYFKVLAGALLVGVVLLNSSCADTSWRSYGHDTTQFSKQPNESTLNASTVSTLDFHSPHGWEFTIPGGGSFTASPSVYDNTVYIGSLNGRFYAIYATGASQGTIRWQYPPAAAPEKAN